jgi:DNA-binding XRE family transcriptional regulator
MPTDTVTPLDRLQEMLATDRCAECSRFTQLEPDELAKQLGVSETTVRRLVQPGYVPSMPTVTKMAAAVQLAPLVFMGKMWPDLAGVQEGDAGV